MSLDSFSADGDWIRIRVKFPGRCIKCNKKLEPGNFCYWSKASKAILHEDCYQLGTSDRPQIASYDGAKNLSLVISKKTLPTLNSKTTKDLGRKCIICSDIIDIDNELISKLSIIRDNGGDVDYSYCAKCLVNFDDEKYELYKKQFMRKIRK